MTMPIKFDTLEYTKRLVEAGIPPDQAETHAHALLAALSESTVAPSELVLVRSDLIARIEMLRTEMNTKIAEVSAKIEEFRTEVNAKIEELRTEMNAKIEELRTEMNAKIEALRTGMNAKFTTVYWMLGVSFALHAVTIGMLWKILDRLP